jgi:2-isopropylmalate synthase
VRNGARQVECSVNGLGERAGNAALEEVVMAIHTRPDFFGGSTMLTTGKGKPFDKAQGRAKPLTTNINTKQIYKTSQLVSRLTGFVIQPNKAIVGANAFAHESGVHVDGVLKERKTYEIMTPETIGLAGSRMVLGRHTGRHGFADRCKKLGYKLTKDEIEQAYQRFTQVADKKKEVFDEDLVAIIDDEVRAIEHTFELEYMRVLIETGVSPKATVKIRTKDGVKEAQADGDGPVDAAYNAIREATGHCPTLESYSIRAVTSGKEALGEAMVKIKTDPSTGSAALTTGPLGAGSRTFTGRGISTDIIEASAKAYIDAINRMVGRPGKEEPGLKAEL